MAHVRKQVRDAVVTLLTGLATTGANVYTGRVYPLDSSQSELPALFVNTPGEEAEPSPEVDRSFQSRTIAIEVEAKVKGGAYVDTLDQIAVEVETALGASITVGGKVVDLDYVGMEFDSSGETDKPVGSLVMRYSAAVSIATGAPSALVVF